MIWINGSSGALASESQGAQKERWVPGLIDRLWDALVAQPKAGLVIMSHTMASTDANAGNPQINQTR